MPICLSTAHWKVRDSSKRFELMLFFSGGERAFHKNLVLDFLPSRVGLFKNLRAPCSPLRFNLNRSDTFFLVLVFLQSRHKQIPKKHHINTVSTSHISHTHSTFTRNAADHNITQSALTRRHRSKSIVRAGKMPSTTVIIDTRANCTAKKIVKKLPEIGEIESWRDGTKNMVIFSPSFVCQGC